MIRSPVFLILGEPRSVAYLGSTDRSGVPLVPTTLSEPISKSILSVCFLVMSFPSLISYFKNGTVLSATSKLLKGSATNPLLNLSNPVVGSVITRVSVFDSRSVRDVTSSRFSILSSRTPISFIVYRLLPREVIVTSLFAS